MAQSLFQQREWDAAHAIASTIEAEYPDFQQQYEVDYLIGRCLSSRAEFESARDAYRQVIRSPKGNKTETAADAHLMIAESYYHQQNYAAALREYLAVEILYDYPTRRAAALLQAAKCHELVGQWNAAADLYTRMLKTYPDSAYTLEATERLRTAGQRTATGQAL